MVNGLHVLCLAEEGYGNEEEPAQIQLQMVVKIVSVIALKRKDATLRNAVSNFVG